MIGEPIIIVFMIAVFIIIVWHTIEINELKALIKEKEKIQ
jgi:hypothetical protein